MNRTSNKPCAHILIVERDPAIVAPLRAMLECAGYRTTDAGNAEEALVTVRETKKIDDGIDIAIIDYMLPDMNGVELIREMEYAEILPPAVIVRCPKGDEALLKKIICMDHLNCGSMHFLWRSAPADEYLSVIEKLVEC